MTGIGHAIGAARAAREELGLALDLPLQDILVAVERDAVSVGVLALEDRVAGAYMPRSGAKGLVFVNLRHRPVRRRFTLAHEYGHHRLGHSHVVDDVAAMAGKRDYDPKEVAANRFASEFLMPVAAVERWCEEDADDGPVTLETVVRFANSFGVSAAAARIRLKTMKIIRDERLIARLDAEIEASEHRDLMKLYPQHEDSLSRVDAAAPRVPPVFAGSALSAYLGGDIDLAALARSARTTPAAMARALAETGLDAVAPPAR